MTSHDQSGDRLRNIEARLALIEERLGMVAPIPVSEGDETPIIPPASKPVRGEHEIELEIGQNWFAKAGIVVLALGMVFLMTFPYTQLRLNPANQSVGKPPAKDTPVYALVFGYA